VPAALKFMAAVRAVVHGVAAVARGDASVVEGESRVVTSTAASREDQESGGLSIVSPGEGGSV
jgi:hypothetical protein